MEKCLVTLSRYPYGHEELAVCDDFDAVTILPVLLCFNLTGCNLVVFV